MLTMQRYIYANMKGYFTVMTRNLIWMGEVTGAQNQICQGQPLIGQGLLFFCYITLEKCISCSDAADTLEYMARKTPVQRIM